MKQTRIPAILVTLILLTLTAVLLATPVAAVDPVHNASDEYKTSRYYANLKSLQLTGDQRTDVVLVALTQLGYHEGNGEADMGGDNLTGSRNFVEYNRLHGRVDNGEGNGVSYGYEWCCSFATWCVRTAGVPISVSKPEISCDRLVTWFENNSTYKTKASGYVPKTGDLIFFKNGSSIFKSNHVGIVRYVSGSYVYTIEGNSSEGTVKLLWRGLNDANIVGYGVPAYASKPSAAIDFSMSGGYPTGTYMILASSLNVRSSPSTGSSANIVGSLSRSTMVTVTETSGGWGKIIYNGAERWISLGSDYSAYVPSARYVIFYNLNGGTGLIPSQPKADGVDTNISFAVPARPGYLFAGWSTRPDAATAEYGEGDVFKLNDDTTLYAVWSTGGVTVKFYNGESLLHSAAYPAGGEAKQPATPVRAGDETYKYTFAGWDINSDGKVDVKPGEKVIASSGLVCRAVFERSYIEYTVRFLGRDGVSLLDERVYHYGESLIIPPTPVSYREGAYAYTFSGWSGVLDASVTGDADYFAIFNETTAKYSVSFIDGNGQLIESGEYEYGEMVRLPDTTPQKDADETYTYSFKGYDSSPGSVIDDSVYRATFTGIYIEYKVSYADGDGNIIFEQTAHYGDVPLPPDLTPTKASDPVCRYEFSGWEEADRPIMGDTLRIPLFIPVERTYAVTFFNADGSVFHTGEYKHGESIIPPAGIPVKTALGGVYTFNGWSPELTSVSGNMSFTATFSFTPDPGPEGPGGGFLSPGAIISLAVVVLAAGGFVAYIVIRGKRLGMEP